MKRIFNASFLFLLLSGFVSSTYAQSNSDIDALVDDSKNDFLIVIGGGLAGAILGLSTLSFVDEPKEHSKNIVMGASIGIILGVGYVMYNQANKSGAALRPGEAEDQASFSTKNRSRWHGESIDLLSSPSRHTLTPYNLSYSFQF